ncbi:MAG: prepilin-type N-terminal cleavage/methylation domain-containing protein [Thermoanaerobaculia bacterium]|jgi:prepilin-type N-terminal cleavage/methylation domain-containing protein
MHRIEPTSERNQRGYTLTEVLVATAIFAIIFVAALLIYDRANKVFKVGVEGADMQQNARVAFDRLVADVRTAGFDHDRDGVPVSVGSNVWKASTTYGLGSTVSPVIYNGFTYRVSAITTGLSGTSEPTWNTTINGTTADNGVTWRTLEGVNSFQQPDEQIEYAGTHAITLRANFDHDLDKANDYGRERDLESVQFPLITTGNDEIVTYALRSEAVDAGGAIPAGRNGDTITFFADVPNRRTFPGGRAENAVNIPNVDLCTAGCNLPPYTLYRFSLNAAGVVQSTPIASAIRDLTLTYYTDVTGTTPLTITDPGGGQYNANTPATSAASRSVRAQIRSVRIQLVAMNESRDPAYTNPAEAGTRAERYRTYAVESLVVPRNLGKQGMREQQASPPGKPRMLRVCVNACRMAYVEWNAPAENPDQGTTEQYGITYDTTPARTKVKLVGAVTSAWVDNLPPAADYYFSVSAINGFGSTPADDPTTAADNDQTIHISGGLTGLNKTKAQPATVLRASGGDLASPASPAEQPNQISLSWNLPLDNVVGKNDLVCYETNGSTTTPNPVKPIGPGELQTWEIRRWTEPDFDPDDPSEYETVTTGTPNILTVGLTTATFVDKTAPNCIDYYYRIRAVEACPGAGSPNDPNDNHTAWFPPIGTNAVKGRSSAVAAPTAPISLLGKPDCVLNTDYVAAEVCNYLVWPKVKTDTATPIPNQILVDTYQLEIERFVHLGAGTGYTSGEIITDPLLPTYEVDPEGTNWLRTDKAPNTGVLFTSNAGDYLIAKHPAAPGVGVETYAYKYTIRALQCPAIDDPELPGDYTFVSDPSPSFQFPCEGSGTTTFDVTDYADGDGTSPGSGYLVQSGLSTIVIDGTNIDSVQVYLTDLNNTTIANLGTITAAPFIFPIAGTEDGQIYRAFALVKDTNGCTNVTTRFIEESTPTGCCLAAVANDPFVVQYTAGRREVDVFLRNGCDSPLTIQPSGIKLTWDPTSTPSGTVLQTVAFPGGGVATVNDSSGVVVLTVPSPGLTTVDASSENYSVTLMFSQTLSNASVTGPVTAFCVTYRRPSLDTSDQNCKIVPEPSTFNSCL